MGNLCNKLYYSLPMKEQCPYCKKYHYISEEETAFKISTSGCRVCRIKMKYFHDANLPAFREAVTNKYAPAQTSQNTDAN